ncbi:hypothetical protein L6R49_10470 [Myxococcota bacterium]|nr:hypothetical protein [Myxococcota bacterium]
MLPLLLLACTSSGGLSLSDTIESGVPDSRINESRLPDSRLADTQKAGDSEAADAPTITTYSCVGKGSTTIITDLNLNIDGKPPDFVLWYHYSAEYQQWCVEQGLSCSAPQMSRTAAVSDDGRLQINCVEVVEIEAWDRIVLVDW